MGVLEALFLVNGGPGSAGGERAERIAAQMGRGAADVVYRPAGRGGALRQMAAELRKRRPRVAYSVDLAVAPVAAWALAGSGARLIVDTGDTPKQFLELIDAPGWRVALANQLERVGYGQSARIIVRGEHHADQVRDLGHDNVTVALARFPNPAPTEQES